MRTFFTLIVVSCFSLFSYAQTMICATAGKGGTANLNAPPGMVFISVTFASYGTPNGACGNFTIGTCHAAISRSIVETALLGKNSGSIAAINGVFGDPCNGTVKSLYVEAVYSAVTPLQLISLSGSATSTDNVLQWQTANEVNTKEFIVERSSDGILFNPVGTVRTHNRLETNNYSYSDNLFENENSFYRLKMVDSDGSFEYSKIVTIKNKVSSNFLILSNPVTAMLTINRLKNGWVEIINLQGKVLQKAQVKTQTLNLDISSYAPGIYFVRHTTAKGIEVRKIMKQ